MQILSTLATNRTFVVWRKIFNWLVESFFLDLFDFSNQEMLAGRWYFGVHFDFWLSFIHHRKNSSSIKWVIYQKQGGYYVCDILVLQILLGFSCTLLIFETIKINLCYSWSWVTAWWMQPLSIVTRRAINNDLYPAAINKKWNDLTFDLREYHLGVSK